MTQTPSSRHPSSPTGELDDLTCRAPYGAPATPRHAVTSGSRSPNELSHSETQAQPVKSSGSTEDNLTSRAAQAGRWSENVR